MKKIISLLILVSISLIYGCDDIFEPDLSDKTVTINTPYDGMTTSQSTITFWWNEVKGADYYNIQIVSPGFMQTQQILADTNVEGDKFYFSLSPGSYQWRIRACNSGGNSNYQTYTLVIDSTEDLNTQTLLLVSPAANDTTNQTSFTFSWNGLYAADTYRFEIWSPAFGSTNVYSSEISNTSIAYTLPEGKYEWGVRAQNSTSSSPYSKRILVVDLTAPGTPTLVSPLNYASLAEGYIGFQWTRGTHSGSSVRDSIVVCSDSTMTLPVLQAYCSNTTYGDTLNAGTYFWHVRSIDKAGNKSAYSVLRKLTVY
ncbi:MAG: hypothetical protein V2A54_11080 [Bacteroidota bacterium]